MARPGSRRFRGRPRPASTKFANAGRFAGMATEPAHVDGSRYQAGPTRRRLPTTASACQTSKHALDARHVTMLLRNMGDVGVARIGPAAADRGDVANRRTNNSLTVGSELAPRFGRQGEFSKRTGPTNEVEHVRIARIARSDLERGACHRTGGNGSSSARGIGAGLGSPRPTAGVVAVPRRRPRRTCPRWPPRLGDYGDGTARQRPWRRPGVRPSLRSADRGRISGFGSGDRDGSRAERRAQRSAEHGSANGPSQPSRDRPVSWSDVVAGPHVPFPMGSATQWFSNATPRFSNTAAPGVALARCSRRRRERPAGARCVLPVGRPCRSDAGVRTWRATLQSPSRRRCVALGTRSRSTRAGSALERDIDGVRGSAGDPPAPRRRGPSSTCRARSGRGNRTAGRRSATCGSGCGHRTRPRTRRPIDRPTCHRTSPPAAVPGRRHRRWPPLTGLADRGAGTSTRPATPRAPPIGPRSRPCRTAARARADASPAAAPTSVIASSIEIGRVCVMALPMCTSADHRERECRVGHQAHGQRKRQHVRIGDGQQVGQPEPADSVVGGQVLPRSPADVAYDQGLVRKRRPAANAAATRGPLARSMTPGHLSQSTVSITPPAGSVRRLG